MKTSERIAVFMCSALIIMQPISAVAEDWGPFGPIWRAWEASKKVREQEQREKEAKKGGLDADPNGYWAKQNEKTEQQRKQREEDENERNKQDKQKFSQADQHPVETASSPAEWMRMNFDNAKGLPSVPQECISELHAFRSLVRSPGEEIKDYPEPILVGSLGANDLHLGDHIEPILGIQTATSKTDKEPYVVVLTENHLLVLHMPTVAYPSKSLDVIPLNDAPVTNYLLK